MKSKSAFLIGFFPLLLMAYGWYLGQLHQSMQDLAGILLFITGSAGLVLAVGVRYALRRQAWLQTWWGNLLLGVAGCIAVFAVLFVYARQHG